MMAAASRPDLRGTPGASGDTYGRRRRGRPARQSSRSGQFEAGRPQADYVLEVGPEAILHAAWRLTSGGRSAVRTRNGDAYRVIYVGRPSDGPDPDFRDAVLQAPDGVLIRGDIEIHVRASGWREHGHGRDRRYNGAVFHVASEGQDEARNSAGAAIPLVLFGPDSSDAAAGRGDAETAAGGPELADLLPRMTLAEAGDHRFLARSSGFQVALRHEDPDEVMWSAVLDGLGYARNRKAFRQLANRLPWATLARACDRQQAEAIEPVLLWAAGFGPRPATGTDAGRIADRISLTGSLPQWAVAAGRPLNRPERRLSAFSELVARWKSPGGPATCLEGVMLADPRPVALVDALTVGAAPGERSLPGRGRAAVIVVNSVLPAIHAIALEAGRWHVVESCLALYRTFPKLPSNSVERESVRILQQLGRTEKVRGARGQQGLIYLYRALTTR